MSRESHVKIEYQTESIPELTGFMLDRKFEV